MKPAVAIPLALIFFTCLVMFAFLVADICASWAGSPWRWLWPVVYALSFRLMVNPVVKGYRRHRRISRLNAKILQGGYLDEMIPKSKGWKYGWCKRCIKEPVAHKGAVFCGAACSQMWEAGDRPNHKSGTK